MGVGLPSMDPPPDQEPRLRFTCSPAVSLQPRPLQTRPCLPCSQPVLLMHALSQKRPVPWLSGPSPASKTLTSHSVALG